MPRSFRTALALAGCCLLCGGAFAQEQESQQSRRNLPMESVLPCTETPGGHGLRLLCPMPTLIFEDSDTASIAPPVLIELKLPEGTPLRIAIDQRTRVRHAGEPVFGHVVQSVYAFDQPVIPAGSIATGYVTQVEKVSKLRYARAYASGDFSPYRRYNVTFTHVTLPNGEVLQIETTVEGGAAEVVHLVTKEASKSDAEKEHHSVAARAAGAAGQEVKDSLHEASTSAHHAADEIRNPGRMHRLEGFLAGQSPYRRQYIAMGTRFNAVLNHELDFGNGSRSREELSNLGTVPPTDSVLHARLVLEVSSATAVRGSPVVAQLTEPLYSPDHRLILPAESRLIGRVLEARPARHLKRNGELRVIFEVIELPGGALQSLQGTLEGIEVDRAAQMKLDEEGGAHTTTSKTRYLSTGMAVALAVVASHPDVEHGGVDTGGDPAVRAGAGASGFGLAGTLIGLAAKSNVVSIVFSAYGASASIYANFLSRGRDVVLPKNAPLEIGLGTSHPGNRKH